jgi:hypothetical protein
MAASTPQGNALGGTARLGVVMPGVAVSVFFGALLDYCLPLYFGALNQEAQARGSSYPMDAWSVLWKYQQIVWIIGPFLAGLFSQRYGERFVWGAALLGQAVIPLALYLDPDPEHLRPVAMWLGLTGSLAWIAGVSLVQAVAPAQKGLANGLTMATLGVGSIVAPVLGKVLLYWPELAGLVAAGEWSAAGKRLVNLTPMTSTPAVADFASSFWLLGLSSVAGGVAIALWCQRPGHFEKATSPGWAQALNDLGRLARCPAFWALTVSLCVLGGPVFAMANQFLPYRAKDLGLISEAQDRGWLWLQVLKPLMWIPGGLAVGLLAGRRAPGIAGVVMLAAFSLAALGIGRSALAWQLFATVALFEFVRQFMRWSHAGYLSEHVPTDLRATAIGCSVTLAGVGGTIASWGADFLWSPKVPGFESSRPFVAAALVGLAGSLLLFVCDRVRPIRGPSTEEAAVNGLPAADAAGVTEA